MKIGIVSDSHGRTDRLRRAVGIFKAHGVDAIVHCGDLGSSDCLAALAESGVAVYVVAGNVDRHAEKLAALAEELSIRFAWEVVKVPLGDGRFLVATHGHDESVLGEFVVEQQFPYVCHGHTHRRRDEHFDKVRVINPGALHNTRTPTVAVLDTAADTVEHVLVPDD